jgi:predicted RecA/RadA family phage recombinase
MYGETTSGNGDMLLNMAASTAAARNALLLRRSRGSLETPEVVQVDDYLGSLLCSGYDGTTFQNPSMINFYVDDTPSSGCVPARISMVTGSSSADRRERMVIKADGDIINYIGSPWNYQIAAAANTWYGVCYGNSLFVAVSSSGTGNRVMTSSDGVTWTSRTSAADNDWRSICYGNSLFVAVSITGTGDRVMTSSDGITWTSQTSAADNTWNSVCYGNSTYVTVASSGTNRVMTSSDGATWTSRSASAANSWYGVCYGNGLFVAVAGSGTGNRVMTSPDGINWTSRTSAADNAWRSVCYGNGLFVAVAGSGTGNRVMTSPDGVTWTSRTSAADYDWRSVCYNNGLFVATAITGTYDQVMFSNDGINWELQQANGSTGQDWSSVTCGNNLWVAVSSNGTYRVMTCDDILQHGLKTQYGYIGVNTLTPTAGIDINSNKMRLRMSRTPTSASDLGNAGDICWDTDYVYICTATNTWKRSALSSW